jgi:hypothetical protein
MDLVKSAGAAWLRAEVGRWRYKPGVRLEAVTPEVGPLRLRVSMSVHDSRAPRTCGELMAEGGASAQDWFTAPMSRPRVNVTGTVVVPSFVLGDCEAFASWLRDTLGQVEAHERDEWLRRDGVLLHDPHDPARQGDPDVLEGAVADVGDGVVVS